LCRYNLIIMENTHKKYILPAIVSLSVIVLDQCTKYLIIKSFALYQSLTVIEHYLTIVHTRNRGIAFGLLSGSGSGMRVFLLIFTSLLAIVFILYLLSRLKGTHTYATVTFSLVLGGAIGNLIDRIRWGAVVDFIDLHWYHYHWPAFNCADSAISIGLVLLIIGIITNKFPS
jgi:signal peptidase II